MSSGRQLALPFPAPSFRAVREFLPGAGSEAALAWLGRTASWPGGRLALWGEAGTGKTHLLELWATGCRAALLPGEALRGLPPPPRTPVAVDDADAAAEEASLLHLLNAAAELGQPVLLAGRTAPAHWQVRLPDLASRLRATVAVQLRPPGDAVLEALLARLMAERQLTVPPWLQAWLLARLPRTGGALREAAARLDRASLATGGRITRPLAQQVLTELSPDDVALPVADASQPGPSLL